MKGTTLTDLTIAWDSTKRAITKRTHAASGYVNKQRWLEIVLAHHRRVVRGKMGTNKPNKAARIAGELNRMDVLSEMIRNNRKNSGLPEIIYTFGNSGTAKSQREASNAGN